MEGIEGLIGTFAAYSYEVRFGRGLRTNGIEGVQRINEYIDTLLPKRGARITRREAGILQIEHKDTVMVIKGLTGGHLEAIPQIVFWWTLGRAIGSVDYMELREAFWIGFHNLDSGSWVE